MFAGDRDLQAAVADLAEMLPEALRPLAAVAYDYRWCWEPDAAALFGAIDASRWERCGANPRRFLSELGPAALRRAAAVQDRIGGEKMRGDHGRGRAAGAGDRRQGLEQRERIDARPAMFRRQVQPHDAELGQCSPVAGGRERAFVDLGRARRQDLGAEGLDGVDHLVVGARVAQAVHCPP